MDKFHCYINEVRRKIKADLKIGKKVMIFIIAYFIILRSLTDSSCVWVIVTGFPCPGCGLTRAGRFILQGRFLEAAKIHFFIYPILFLAVYFLLNRYLLLRKTSKWMEWALIITIILMLVYYVYRMAHYFPGEPPMSYYSHNLISYLMHR